MSKKEIKKTGTITIIQYLSPPAPSTIHHPPPPPPPHPRLQKKPPYKKETLDKKIPCIKVMQAITFHNHEIKSRLGEPLDQIPPKICQIQSGSVIEKQMDG